MALIFLYKCCKYGEKICNNSRDIEFFLGDYFFWRALYIITASIHNKHDYIAKIAQRKSTNGVLDVNVELMLSYSC